MRECVERNAGVGERSQIAERSLGHGLWKEQCACREPDAGRVKSGGQRMIGAERARCQHARVPARTRLSQKQLERPHLVATVYGGRTVVALDPGIAVASTKLTGKGVERFDARRENTQGYVRHALRKLRKQFEEREAHEVSLPLPRAPWSFARRSLGLAICALYFCHGQC